MQSENKIRYYDYYPEDTKETAEPFVHAPRLLAKGLQAKTPPSGGISAVPIKKKNS